MDWFTRGIINVTAVSACGLGPKLTGDDIHVQITKSVVYYGVLFFEQDFYSVWQSGAQREYTIVSKTVVFRTFLANHSW